MQGLTIDPHFLATQRRLEDALTAIGLTNSAVGDGFDGLAGDVAAVNPSAHRDPENEQTVPLAANATWTGSAWHQAADMHSVIITYATDAAPAGVFLEWSADGVAPGTGPYDVAPLPIHYQNGTYGVVYIENIMLRPWMRLSVVNGPAAQTWVSALTACLKGPFTGFWQGLEDALSPTTVALTGRSLVVGKAPSGAYRNVQVDEAANLQVSSLQIKDTGNSTTAVPTVAAPYRGVPYPTLASGVVGTTFTVAGPAGKGGTVVFNYAPTTNQTPAAVPVRVPLRIADLSNPLLIPLQNVDNYFWVEFTPDDNTLTWLAISTVHQRTAPPPLVRFLSQAITDNEPVVSQRAFLSARKADGSWPPVGFGQGPRAGSLPTTLATEDLAVLNPVGTAKRIITIGNTLVKTGPGVLKRVIAGGVGTTTTITFYDSLTASGTVLMTIRPTINVGAVFPIDAAFTTGLTAVCLAATDITVVYQ